jgi:hypothetical protein
MAPAHAAPMEARARVLLFIASSRIAEILVVGDMVYDNKGLRKHRLQKLLRKRHASTFFAADSGGHG